MKPGRKPIHDKISAILLDAIADGRYCSGDKIPSDRELCKMAGLSYMTVRAGIQELVDSGLLVRKERIGTFIADDIEEKLEKPRLNILCRQSESQFDQIYRNLLIQNSANRNFRMNVVDYSDETIEIVIRTLTRKEPCISLFDPRLTTTPKYARYIQNNPYLITVGYDLSGIGVKSILCDDNAAARLATAVLQQAGHKKIAIFLKNPDDPIQHQMLEGWFSLMLLEYEEAEVEHMVMVVPNEDTATLEEDIHTFVAGKLARKEWDCTAAVCIYPDMAAGVLKAFQSAGMSIPQDVSLISLGLYDLLSGTNPQISCIDPHFDTQIQTAFDYAENIILDKFVKPLCLVRPQLIQGQSIITHA